MPFGYTGNILHIDLTDKKFWIEHPEEKFYRTYWGGRALALYYMLKEMEAGIDPFSKDNLLIFAPSVVVGTKAPLINRFTVCAKSPLTGGQGESEAGGYWGPELKKAGFDAIIFRGKSDSPVYLWIHDGNVKIKDADHLWGKDTLMAQEIIKKELGDSEIKIAQIGLAGENLVRFANIVNELIHFNGRTGLGAVMGSKKLKAIAVRGTQDIQVSDKEKIKTIARQISKRVMKNPLSRTLREIGTNDGIQSLYEIGCLPTKNWTTGYFEKGENVSEDKINLTIVKKNATCYACPISCKRIVEINDSDIKVNPQFGGTEYEAVVALGPICGVGDLKYIAKANELCNKYTMDTISTGMTIAFAMQCYEEGILSLKDTDNLKLNFGNKKALVSMVEKIAKKEGLGAILAEGSLRASKRIGKGSERFIHVVKGQEIPMHDPRMKTGVGLQYIFADYGADHMKAAHDFLFMSQESWGIKELSGLGIHEPVSPEDISINKVKLFKKLDIYWSLLDILGVCVFGYVPRSLGTMEELLEIIRTITGWRTTWFELMRLGERSINMAHIFNLREGFTPKDDKLPEVFFTNFKGGLLDGKKAIDRKEFYEAAKLRYELMGWDKNTSIPSRSKLNELDLDWLIEE